MSLEAAQAGLPPDLAGVELLQSQDIASTAAEHQVKHEPATFSVDVKVENESEVGLVQQEPEDIALEGNCEDDLEPALGAKSLQTPDMTFTVRVEVKHESEVSPELQTVDNVAVKCEDASKRSMLDIKTLQIPEVDFGVGVCVSSCDSDAGKCALQQIVAGCFVKLRRLRIIQCDVCRRVFQKRSLLVAHLIDHHADDEPDTSYSDEKNCEPNVVTEEPDTSDNLKLYPCKICHEQFAFECHMKIHKLKHWGREPPTCDICQKDFATKSILVQHMKTHFKELSDTGGELIPCEICKKTFTNRLKLKKHVQRHTRPKRYSCKQCGKPFAIKANLIIHNRVHTGEKPFSCNVCKKEFAHKSALTTHYRKHTGEKTIHTGENKLYSCDHCDKHFTSKVYLIGHTNVHKGLKPYVCEICTKTFYRKAYLRKHMNVHTGEKRKSYGCKICGKSFSQSYLTIHKRVHTGDQPYKCDICNETFHRKLYLTRHKSNHMDVKPYICEFCKKAFGQKCDLVVHVRSHTGEKPYKCEICKNAFSHKSNLSRHIRVDHEKT